MLQTDRQLWSAFDVLLYALHGFHVRYLAQAYFVSVTRSPATKQTASASANIISPSTKDTESSAETRPLAFF